MMTLMLKMEEDGVTGRHLADLIKRIASGELETKNATLYALRMGWSSHMQKLERDKGAQNFLLLEQGRNFFFALRALFGSGACQFVAINVMLAA